MQLPLRLTIDREDVNGYFSSTMKGIHSLLLTIFLLAIACGSAKPSDEPLVTGWYHVVDGEQGIARQSEGGATYYLDPTPVVKASHFKTMTVESFPHDNTLWQIVVHLDERGREVFAKATEELIGQDLVFVLDDSLWSEPIRIQAKIPSGVMVLNKKEPFSKKEAEELRDRISASNEEQTP